MKFFKKIIRSALCDYNNYSKPEYITYLEICVFFIKVQCCQGIITLFFMRYFFNNFFF